MSQRNKCQAENCSTKLVGISSFNMNGLRSALDDIALINHKLQIFSVKQFSDTLRSLYPSTNCLVMNS